MDIASEEEMEYRRYVYICEGVTDEDKLKKLGCLFVVPTGGKYIRKEITSFLKKLAQYRKFVLILDPDGPGNEIRKRVETYCTQPVIQVFASQEKANNGKKIGIAQMNMEDLKQLVFPFVRHDMLLDENLSFEEDDFYDLRLVGGAKAKERRMKLVEKYSLPYTSAKKVMEYLWMLGINSKTLEEDLKDE